MDHGLARLKQGLPLSSHLLRENHGRLLAMGRYVELLDGVRQQGDWEAWIEFFLAGVECTASASAAVAMAQRLLELFHADALSFPTAGKAKAAYYA